MVERVCLWISYPQAGLLTKLGVKHYLSRTRSNEPRQRGNTMKQYVFQNGMDNYYLVDIYEDGTVTLKIKTQGWGDIWTLPLEEVTR